jgi:hypothetical protein
MYIMLCYAMLYRSHFGSMAMPCSKTARTAASPRTLAIAAADLVVERALKIAIKWARIAEERNIWASL